MKNARQVIGAKKAKRGEDTKGLGIITFGKTRPDKTKYVLVDIEYDAKAGNDLYKCGMIALKHDREAVIEYVIKKGLKEYANLGRKNK